MSTYLLLLCMSPRVTVPVLVGPDRAGQLGPGVPHFNEKNEATLSKTEIYFKGWNKK